MYIYISMYIKNYMCVYMLKKCVSIYNNVCMCVACLLVKPLPQGIAKVYWQFLMTTIRV